MALIAYEEAELDLSKEIGMLPALLIGDHEHPGGPAILKNGEKDARGGDDLESLELGGGLLLPIFSNEKGNEALSAKPFVDLFSPVLHGIR